MLFCTNQNAYREIQLHLKKWYRMKTYGCTLASVSIKAIVIDKV